MKHKYKKFIFLFIGIIFFLAGVKHSLAAGDYQDEGTAFFAQTGSAGYTYEGVGFYAPITQVANSLPVYRFYKANGDHFFTISEDEKNTLVNNSQSGYSLEGVAFYAFASQIDGTIPVYRFYSTTKGDHFFTASEAEKDTLTNNAQWGYSYEGIAFYVYPSQASETSPIYRLYNSSTGFHFYTASEAEKDAISTIPVYRFYNLTTGDHFYTSSQVEADTLNGNKKYGYKSEGVAFYAFSTQVADSSPVYRFYNSTTGDHFYTISEDEKNSLINNSQSGYAYEGVVFYAYASQINGSSPVYRLYNPSTGDHFYTISLTEKNYYILPALGPDISVGLYYINKSDIGNSPFEISANKDYEIVDKNGNVIATVSGDKTTKVIYDSNNNLEISGSISSTLANSYVTFKAADGDNSTLIFDVNRPNSSYDHYRGEVKVQYYHGSDIYGGNTGSTVSQVWIINILPLEQYTWGSGEVTGTGPLEHTKVMTTIFRTYGYWYIKYATKYAPYGFQIRSDSGSQVYWGYDWEKQFPNVKKAAEDTQGVVVTYDGDVALTPYSSWSDGKTRSAQEVWNTDAYPWCQSVSDPYGKNPTMTTAQLEADGNHMVGLIAHGSLNLAQSPYNWNYQKILKYYYTGISLTAFY